MFERNSHRRGMHERWILLVHHDADLYGADQSLIRTIKALVVRGWRPIVAVPHDGPLISRLVDTGAEVHIGPVGKLKRQLLRPSGLSALARDLTNAYRFLNRIVAKRPIELVYTNSIAALGGALWGALHGLPRVWHVREIVVAPWFAAAGFPVLLHALGGWCVCNSQATRTWITKTKPALAHRSSVIWNGLETDAKPRTDEAAAFRRAMGFEPHHVVATLVGRINRMKGQSTLIEAAGLMSLEHYPDLRFLIVGDAPEGQDHFRVLMSRQISEAGLQDRIKCHPFKQDIDTVWASSQIALVPSIEPESFGRVAIEAMAHGLPVIASAHGGLREIVVDDLTGALVPPADPLALAAAIGRLAKDEQRRIRQGEAGRQRQSRLFSQSAHDEQLLATIEQVVRRGRA